MELKNHRKWLLFLLITLFSLWLGGYIQRELQALRPQSPNGLYDFHVYYISGLIARSGSDKRLYSYQEIQNPNDPSQTIVVNPQLQPFNPNTTFGILVKGKPLGGQYLYPPFFSMLVVPLTYLSGEKAGIFFHIFLFLLIAASIFLTVKLLYEDYLVIALYSSIATILSEFTYPVQNLLNLGNVGAIILFLTIAGIYFHKKYPSFSSFFFALAVMIKLTPIIVIPLMIIRKQWKWLIAFCGWSFLLLGISIWGLGWQNHNEFLTKVLPAMSAGVPFSGNKSLITTFYAVTEWRFLSIEEIRAGEYIFPPKLPVALFKTAATLSFCVLLLYFWRVNKNDSQLSIEILILTLWSLIFTPISFPHYYVLALSPIIFAWLHPGSKTASFTRLIILSAATFMVFSFLPIYAFSKINLFPIQLALFMVMPLGIILCIWYLTTLLKYQDDQLFKDY